MDLGNISIILVSPENPDNIGAATRAMKNMGFSDLRLVTPPKDWRRKAKKLAMSAADILKTARMFASTEEACADLQITVGTTRRISQGRGEFLEFDVAIERLRKSSKKMKCGIVFGRESKGLANKDLKYCDFLMAIPTAKIYPSLNLAQAVMVVVFTLSSGRNRDVRRIKDNEPYLDQKEIGITLANFELALRTLGYQEGGANLLPRILTTTRNLIKRSGLLEKEAQMIKGLSRRIREKVLCKRDPRIEYAPKESNDYG